MSGDSILEDILWSGFIGLSKGILSEILENLSPDTVFISYAREDKKFVRKLTSDLKHNGVEAWIDKKHIHGGKDWSECIALAIDKCKAVLVILSPDGVKSKWVNREVAYADDNDKQIVPLLYVPTELPPKLQLLFGHTEIVDFTRGKYKKNLDKLLNSLS